jgi:hypothetical protein
MFTECVLKSMGAALRPLKTRAGSTYARVCVEYSERRLSIQEENAFKVKRAFGVDEH